MHVSSISWSKPSWSLNAVSQQLRIFLGTVLAITINIFRRQFHLAYCSIFSLTCAANVSVYLFIEKFIYNYNYGSSTYFRHRELVAMTLSRGKQRRRRKTAKPLFSAKALVARNEFKKRSRKGGRLRKGNQAVGTRFDIVILISEIKKLIWLTTPTCLQIVASKIKPA